MGENINNLLKDVEYPNMIKIRQNFASSAALDDIPQSVYNEVSRSEIACNIKPGQSIAITVGSRGVANLALITRELVRCVRDLGAKPFIIPAMGSHGGATAEGQVEILESLGVTEEYIEAPIHASMDVVKIGETEEGTPVYIDKFAAEADGIIVMHRIKSHCSFRGKYESGLMKMMTIGLGKQYGAHVCHFQGFGRIVHNLHEFGTTILKNTNVVFGITMLENAYNETYKILAIPSDEIPAVEPELLLESKEQMPEILFPEFDILIVDRIGKNISGDGMDANITGRYCTPYASGGPEYQKLLALDLTEETHGNAIGVGQADYTTRRLYDKMRFDSTYPNAITSGDAKPIRIPMVLDSDKLAIGAAIYGCSNIDTKNVKIVRLDTTLNTNEFYISESLLEQAKSNPQIEIVGELEPFGFDEGGHLF